jgi:ABC-type xylose transport system permease subunit
MTRLQWLRLLVDLLGLLAFAVALVNIPAMWTIGQRIAYAKRTKQNGGMANALWAQMHRAIGRFLIGGGVVVLISFRGINRLMIVLYIVVLVTLYLSIADWWRTRRALQIEQETERQD